MFNITKKPTRSRTEVLLMGTFYVALLPHKFPFGDFFLLQFFGPHFLYFRIKNALEIKPRLMLTI